MAIRRACFRLPHSKLFSIILEKKGGVYSINSK